MYRKILLASIAAIVGYVIGVRAGFSAGVRDYLENDSALLERTAIESDKYEYSGAEKEAAEASGDRTFH